VTGRICSVSERGPQLDLPDPARVVVLVLRRVGIRLEQEAVGVAPHHGTAQLGDPLDRLPWPRAGRADIAEADDLVGPGVGDVGEHLAERHHVAVHVRDQRDTRRLRHGLGSDCLRVDPPGGLRQPPA
jgi:hypothetical protein